MWRLYIINKCFRELCVLDNVYKMFTKSECDDIHHTTSLTKRVVRQNKTEFQNLCT